MISSASPFPVSLIFRLGTHLGFFYFLDIWALIPERSTEYVIVARLLDYYYLETNHEDISLWEAPRFAELRQRITQQTGTSPSNTKVTEPQKCVKLRISNTNALCYIKYCLYFILMKIGRSSCCYFNRNYWRKCWINKNKCPIFLVNSGHFKFSHETN